jgi:translation initiation factor IF-3
MQKRAGTGGFRKNEEIRVRQVRLVDADGQMRGVVPTEEALKLAREGELDLVEVSPNADPPVCKLLDYGKYRYKQQKRDHEARRKQRGGELKEIRFRPKTDQHDLGIKLDRVRHFLGEGHRVQLSLIFRGREMQNLSLGNQLLDELVRRLEDVAKIERNASREGRRMSLVVMPKPGVKKEREPREKERPASERAKAKEASRKPSGGEAEAARGGTEGAPAGEAGARSASDSRPEDAGPSEASVQI